MHWTEAGRRFFLKQTKLASPNSRCTFLQTYHHSDFVAAWRWNRIFTKKQISFYHRGCLKSLSAFVSRTNPQVVLAWETESQKLRSMDQFYSQPNSVSAVAKFSWLLTQGWGPSAGCCLKLLSPVSMHHPGDTSRPIYHRPVSPERRETYLFAYSNIACRFLPRDLLRD